MDFENTGKDLGRNKWEGLKMIAYANTLSLTLMILIFFANMRGTVPISMVLCALLFASWYQSLEMKNQSFPELIQENFTMIIGIIVVPIWINY